MTNNAAGPWTEGEPLKDGKEYLGIYAGITVFVQSVDCDLDLFYVNKGPIAVSGKQITCHAEINPPEANNG